MNDPVSWAEATAFVKALRAAAHREGAGPPDGQECPGCELLATKLYETDSGKRCSRCYR